MTKGYWLVKQEPESYSWSTFVRDGGTSWTGVRNFQARNNLRSMKTGDVVFYYHTGDEKQIVGLAKVTKDPYPDPTGKEEKGDWVAVELTPWKPLANPVTLKTLRADPRLTKLQLLTHSRLSVSSVPADDFARILEHAKTPAAA
jgi:predicted RNA-binding protein with PUA-like domain